MISRIIGIILLVAILWVVSAVYSSLVTLRNHVDYEWHVIENQLKVQHDLVPMLVATAKSHGVEDSTALDEVSKAYIVFVAASDPHDRLVTSRQLSAAVFELLSSCSDNPELSSLQSFSQLRDTLTESARKIPRALKNYNEAVLKYNNGIQTFPGNLFAGVFQFNERSGFESLQAELS